MVMAESEFNNFDEIECWTTCKQYFYYFAYGSNLLSERIRLSNPSATKVGIGMLSNHLFGFAGPSSSTWKGCSATIYPFDDGDIIILNLDY